MIGLFVFLTIAVMYISLGLLIERRNGHPSHDQRIHHVTTYCGNDWTGSGFFGGGDCGGGGGDCGGGGGGDCGGF